MSRKRVIMSQIRDILQYKFEHKMSNQRIALALKISKGSVHNTLLRFKNTGLSWPVGLEVSDSEFEALLHKNSTGNLQNVNLPSISYLEQELRRPKVTLQCLYDEYRQENPNGMGRTCFYDYFSKNRPADVHMKMLHKGGEKLFVDYSGDSLAYIDKENGSIIDVELFVCSWGASSHSYAECTHTQQLEDFIQSNIRAFQYFNACPKVLVPDNLKSAVTKACNYDPSENRHYKEMAKHYGAVILPARKAAPRDKATVESNVLHVQRYILARLRNRTFYSLEEINEAVWVELENYNKRPMKDYGNRTRFERFAELDKPYALSLPANRFAISRIQENVLVGRDYHIRFNERYYSVPYQLARHRVDVFQSGLTIEIYHDGQHVCRHRIGSRKYSYTTDSKHMPAAHSFVKGWSKRWFIFKAGEIGPATAEAVKKIMESREHVEQGYKAAMGVLRLAKTYQHNRLENAAARALHFGSVSYRSLKSILEQRLDEQSYDIPNKTQTAPVNHDNIRGAQYYQS